VKGGGNKRREAPIAGGEKKRSHLSMKGGGRRPMGAFRVQEEVALHAESSLSLYGRGVG